MWNEVFALVNVETTNAEQNRSFFQYSIQKLIMDCVAISNIPRLYHGTILHQTQCLWADFFYRGDKAIDSKPVASTTKAANDKGS